MFDHFHFPRIAAAYEALRAYGRTDAARGVEDDDDLTVGLITDLLHAADEAGQDPAAALERAWSHFEEEAEA